MTALYMYTTNMYVYSAVMFSPFDRGGALPTAVSRPSGEGTPDSQSVGGKARRSIRAAYRRRTLQGYHYIEVNTRYVQPWER